MTSEVVIAGVTFPNYVVKALPTIPGLRSMAFFGSGYDASNGNRVAGGPTIGHSTITPVLSADHCSVNGMNTNVRAAGTTTFAAGAVTGVTITNAGSGYTSPPAVTFGGGGGSGAAATATISGGAVTGVTITNPGSGYTSAPVVAFSGGNLACWRTGVTRASQLAGGWSWAAVARSMTSDAAPSAVLCDNVGNISGLLWSLSLINSDPLRSNLPWLSLHTNGPVVQSIQLSSPTLNNYHFIAETYSGGAAGTSQLYDLTTGQTATPWTASGVSAAGGQELCVGLWGDNTSAAAVPPTNPYGIDVPWFMTADGVLSLASIQGIYASVKSILARRTVVC